MADSSTVRSRRARLHGRGDHSLCRHGDAQGVEAALAALGAQARLAAAPEPSPLVEAALALQEPADGPGRVLVELARWLAGRLADTTDDRAASSMAGGLAGILAQLGRQPSAMGRRSRLDEMRAARAATDRHRGQL